MDGMDGIFSRLVGDKCGHESLCGLKWPVEGTEPPARGDPRPLRALTHMPSTDTCSFKYPEIYREEEVAVGHVSHVGHSGGGDGVKWPLVDGLEQHRGTEGAEGQRWPWPQPLQTATSHSNMTFW